MRLLREQGRTRRLASACASLFAAQALQLHRKRCSGAVHFALGAVWAGELLTIEHKCLSNKHKLAECCRALQYGRGVGTY